MHIFLINTCTYLSQWLLARPKNTHLLRVLLWLYAHHVHPLPTVAHGADNAHLTGERNPSPAHGCVVGGEEAKIQNESLWQFGKFIKARLSLCDAETPQSQARGSPAADSMGVSDWMHPRPRPALASPRPVLTLTRGGVCTL